MDFSILITIGALILSIILHEVAHGFAANWPGDTNTSLNDRRTCIDDYGVRHYAVVPQY